jgi:ATP-binding cassette subfamily B protein
LSPEQLLLPLTVTFALAALIAGAMRLLLIWASTRLSFAAGSDLSSGIYYRTLYQSYAVHTSRNSSEIIDGITVKVNAVIYSVIVPILTFISSCVVLVAIVIALLSISPEISLFAFAGFSLIYLFIILLTRHRLLRNSRLIALESTKVIKTLQEGLGGIRDILIDGSQPFYYIGYRNSDLPLRRSQGDNLFISQSPRYVMEALGMILIATLAYILAKKEGGIVGAIPILGVLALAAQRLLPALQQMYGAWAAIRGAQGSLEDVLALLDQGVPSYFARPIIPLSFQKDIKLTGLRFRYSREMPWVFNGLDLTIVKGSRTGFIGSTGSGKSTLVDIIMGLLPPSEGGIEVDGCLISDVNNRSWQSHIAHVPQAIFLADISIEENIAFGIPRDQINRDLVKEAALQAQIADIIESWPKQYETIVGERGIRLSGGQRQRIGIARALYRKADLIIFDEATSALDHETEEAVMQAIEDLSSNLTLIIIAHRLTTLRGCSEIIELGQSGIVRKGNYESLFLT